MPNELRPSPFIVGAPRSGTTLLRLMLDAHPEIAIPAETGVFITLAEAAKAGALPKTAEELWALLTQSATWPDLALDAAVLRKALNSQATFSLGSGLRTFYGLYAGTHGKSGWGDKSPMHCYHLPLIQETLPEAHVLHLIRDGRDVAVSLREVWFSPSDDISQLASYWAAAVRAGRRGGECCDHYLEVRYEELVTNPRQTLQAVCSFLRLPFDEAMLDYHHTAQARLSEAKARVLADGTVITLEQRLQQQRWTSSPPDPSRLQRWQRALSKQDVASFESEAGDLLSELGYELASPR
jgi:hypothetical protein